MKLSIRALFILGMTTLFGCAEYSEITPEKLDAYFEESGINSFSMTYLEKEDASYYYIKSRTGTLIYDYFKIKKEDIYIDVSGELPVNVKDVNIKRKK